MLLGRPLKDLDLVCKGARELAAALAQAHGARCIPLGQDHDPPSFRVVDPMDHEDYLDLTELAGGDIVADLGRRDFTANALALRLGDVNQLIDPFQGLQDIRQGLLRHVNPSALDDDPVRILRGFRLGTQRGWSIAPDTLNLMALAAPLLARTAGERIAAELRLILSCFDAYCAIRAMADLRILDVLLPEIAAMRGCTQNRFHHLDVFEHSMASLKACEAVLADPAPVLGDLAPPVLGDLTGWRLPWLKLAVLLHDVGKPGTRALHPSTGQATFYGHDALGAEMTAEIALRLRLSRSEGTYISALIRNHLHTGAILTPRSTTKARMRLLRRLGPDLIPSIVLCIADTRATLGPCSTREFRRTTIDQGLRLIRESRESAATILAAPPLLSGHDLLQMGMTPGPDLGRVLKIVREAQDAGAVRSRKQALALAEKMVHKV